MSERPILFSGPMVRAILEGRKTQTRRVVKLNASGRAQRKGRNWHLADPECVLACPYGVPGDRLWVRETWAEVMHVSPATDDLIDVGRGKIIEPAKRGAWASPEDVGWSVWEDKGRVIVYRADGGIEFCDGDGFSGDMRNRDDCPTWSPSIHMPRWASRITLEVVSVRVERVREITAADCYSEGFPFPTIQETADYHKAGRVAQAHDWYHELWDSINAKKHPWSSNPWVWVVEFKRIAGGAA